jgi:putative ABC transport system substrate-binding protein
MKRRTLPSLAADLVRRQVAIIITTGGTQAALAAKTATTTIPIVFTTGGDPVREGLVQSLNRPGGNLTGVTTSYDEAAPKRLGLLREILPSTAVIGVLVNPNDPITASSETKAMHAAARLVGQRIEILQAGTERDIDAVFANLIDMRVGALVVAAGALFATQEHQLNRASGTPCHTHVVLAPRVRRGWRPHELRIEPCRRASPGGRLRRSHPQRREAG